MEKETKIKIIKIIKGDDEMIKGESITDNTRKTLVYKENGIEYAEGVGIVDTVKNYYIDRYGLEEGDFGWWKEYPRNKDYEVSDLGFVRRKGKDKVLNMSLKDVYEEGDKSVWRLRVTIPGVGTLKVSQVVMETYGGEKKDKDLIVGHYNDVPIDNRVGNLGYITKEENQVYESIWRDYNLKGLDKTFMEEVKDEIDGYLSEVYGTDTKYITSLTKEDMEEIQQSFITYEKDWGTVDIGVLTIGEVYNYYWNKEGILKELEDASFLYVGGEYLW